MGCHILSSRKTTPLSVQKLASGLDEKVSPPASIKPQVFTNLAWDNINRIEETLSGKETSHHVNRIAVQPRVFGPAPPPKDLPHIDKKKQSTLNTEHQPQLDTYVAGPRVGPHPLKSKDAYAGEANKAERNAEQKNLLCSLLGKSIQKTKRCPVGRDLTSKQGIN